MPETVVCPPIVLQDRVKIIFRSSLDRVPLNQSRRNLAHIEWSQDGLPVWKEERVPYVEENRPRPPGHMRIVIDEHGTEPNRDSTLTLRGKTGNIVPIAPLLSADFETPLMLLSLTASFSCASALQSWARTASHLQPLLLMLLQSSERKGDVYDILWGLVFGFATLNILALVARRFEPSRTRMNFGETIAVMVVVVALFLLGWEMLYLFKVLPIKLEPHSE